MKSTKGLTLKHKPMNVVLSQHKTNMNFIKRSHQFSILNNFTSSNKGLRHNQTQQNPIHYKINENARGKGGSCELCCEWVWLVNIQNILYICNQNEKSKMSWFGETLIPKERLEDSCCRIHAHVTRLISRWSVCWSCEDSSERTACSWVLDAILLGSSVGFRQKAVTQADDDGKKQTHVHMVTCDARLLEMVWRSGDGIGLSKQAIWQFVVNIFTERTEWIQWYGMSCTEARSIYISRKHLKKVVVVLMRAQ